MPEIWLNYGTNEVVLDIKAENLEQKTEINGTNLSDSEIDSKLETLDISKPTEIVVLNVSDAVRKTLSVLFEKYEKQSIQKPVILADKEILPMLKKYLPEHSVSEFNNIENSNLIFLGEMEFDGLFGFETISTRLLKKFGTELMLSAYEKRKNDQPSPGENVESFKIAQKFSKKFDILGIEIIANSNGICDLAVDHPSSTTSLTKAFGSYAEADIGKHKTMIVSTGKESSNNTVYVVETLKEKQDGTFPSLSYEVKSEIIGAVVESNQILRPWDNVPIKAKSQEVTANRLIYANYYQNYKIAKKAGVKFLAYRCYLNSKEIKIEKKINIVDE